MKVGAPSFPLFWKRVGLETLLTRGSRNTFDPTLLLRKKMGQPLQNSFSPPGGYQLRSDLETSS